VAQLRTFAQGESLIDLAAKRGPRQRGPLAWMLCDMALSTGLRVGEIAALKLSDVDLKRQIITVTRLKKKVMKEESLPISKELCEHLKEYIEHQRLPSDSDSLWIGKRGPMHRSGLQFLWIRALKRAGLAKDGKALYSIHCARHTLATHLLAKTGNLRLVQKTLGHSSPVTTALIYADVTPEDMRAGVEGLYQEKK
jgi:integrase